MHADHDDKPPRHKRRGSRPKPARIWYYIHCDCEAKLAEWKARLPNVSPMSEIWYHQRHNRWVKDFKKYETLDRAKQAKTIYEHKAATTSYMAGRYYYEITYNGKPPSYVPEKK